MDDRYYPSEALQVALERKGIVREKQDLLSLLALLPSRFFHDNIRFYLEIRSYPSYTIIYQSDEYWYTKYSHQNFVEVVAEAVFDLLEKKVIPPHMKQR